MAFGRKGSSYLRWLEDLSTAVGRLKNPPPPPPRLAYRTRAAPRRRASRSTSFTVGDLKGYITTGMYEDGRVAELFAKVSKQGSTLSGLLDGLSMAVSLGLQIMGFRYQPT